MLHAFLQCSLSYTLKLKNYMFPYYGITHFLKDFKQYQFKILYKFFQNLNKKP